MRIALVILHADRIRGGAEGYTLHLAEALAKRGHEVSLLASSFSDLIPPQVKRIPIAASGFTRVGRYRRFLKSLDDVLKVERFDIVHAMLPVNSCDVYHPHAGMATSKEVQTGARLLFNHRRKAMADTERALLSSASPPVVISLSEYVKRDILASYPELRSDRLMTLFNAVGLDYFDPSVDRDRAGMRASRGIRPTDVVALIVAQDFERKGVPQAIEATALINAALPQDAPRLKLLVVGAGHAPGTDGDIIYAGANWKVVLFYAAADFFVLPTRHDPCSLVVLEALSMGLPVISTVFNGATEIMEDGKHGFVLPSADDVDALTAAMRKLMDRDTRVVMSQNCLALRPALSYDHHLDTLMAIYERVRDSPSPSGRGSG